MTDDSGRTCSLLREADELTKSTREQMTRTSAKIQHNERIRQILALQGGRPTLRALIEEVRLTSKLEEIEKFRKFVVSFREILTQESQFEDAAISKIMIQSLIAASIFDPSAYLRLNPDVAKAGLDPGDHFYAYGAEEGRVISDEEVRRSE